MFNPTTFNHLTQLTPNIMLFLTLFNPLQKPYPHMLSQVLQINFNPFNTPRGPTLSPYQFQDNGFQLTAAQHTFQDGKTSLCQPLNRGRSTGVGRGRRVSALVPVPEFFKALVMVRGMAGHRLVPHQTALSGH